VNTHHWYLHPYTWAVIQHSPQKNTLCPLSPLERGVVSLLVYTVIQRQVRLYLHTHDQRLPGNKGETATPTAAVVLALFAQVALVHFWIGDQEVAQVYGIQPYHLLICDALGLDSSWYEAPLAHKNGRFSQSP